MIRRILATILFAWIAGFCSFVLFLPGPAGAERTDAIVVPTGGAGRIERGLAELDGGRAAAMLVTGVGRQVRPAEFEAQYKVPHQLMRCCVALGFAALNTRGNAAETAGWVREKRYRSLRLVTSDWHMRRAALELGAALPRGVTVVEDAVPTKPGMRTLFIEYHKLIASSVSRLLSG